MSSRNLEWTSGDEVNLDIPGLNAQWPATIVRSGAEHLHLRLREEPHL
ncbi:MAG: hypothetical protein AAFU79_29875 [Myxococcota bacterium]